MQDQQTIWTIDRFVSNGKVVSVQTFFYILARHPYSGCQFIYYWLEKKRDNTLEPHI